jgi:hypothetical protein
MSYLRPPEAQSDIRWINQNLAVGLPAPMDGWRAVRARGVHAVVDLNRQCNTVAVFVREHGMRYLRLGINKHGLPEVEELHIVTSWVQERIRENGPVLLHDGSIRGNDALLACAVLVKDGGTLEKALHRVGAITGIPFTQSQMLLLHQFVAQRAVATNPG